MRVGRLKKVVQEIIDPLKCGGRVVQSGKGDEKVFVYDLHTWPHEYTALILSESGNEGPGIHTIPLWICCHPPSMQAQ